MISQTLSKHKQNRRIVMDGFAQNTCKLADIVVKLSLATAHNAKDVLGSQKIKDLEEEML